ncbi:PDZ domain-containing protein [Staphylococcus pettenkoferi]|nr:PDZ domain-containing protein [Staphylococcus pettenkoferi]
MEGLCVDKNEKHVIPRHKYKRKRREFFHNEEREARVKREQERQEREQQREAQLAKNNEERVKDNMRKARIEKLTQEEIQHQHERAVQEEAEDYHRQVEQTDEDETDQHLSEPDNSHEEIAQQDVDAETQIGEDSGEAMQLESSDAHHQSQKPHSLNNDKQESRHHLKGSQNNEEEQGARDRNSEPHVPTSKRSQKTVHQDETGNHKKVADKDKLRDAQDNKASNEGSNFYSEQAQQSRVERYVSDDEKKPAHHLNTSNRDQNTTSSDKHGKQRDILETVRNFLTQHWAKLLIALGVLLLIILIFAIFNNVNNNGKGSNHLFQSNNDDDKHYTETMKSANSAIHSVVTVENDTDKSRSSADKETQESGKDNELGSGVVYKKVDDAIYVMTNAHVVGDKKKQKITYGDNDSTTGTVIGTDKWSDIAVVKANVKQQSDVKPIKMGDSSNLVLGEPIIVVGNPLGVDFKGSVSKGIISGLNRHVPVDIDKDGEYDELMNAIQMDAPINPGNSGGAVVDRRGKLIGIASLKIDMDKVEGMAFALPVNDAQSIAKQLEDKGEVKYPNTGLKVTNLSDLNEGERASLNLPNDVDKGIIVEDVNNGSLGDKAGLRKNDVIVKLDDKEVEDKLRYRQIIFNHKDDHKSLTAKVYRNGKVKDIQIKLK